MTRINHDEVKPIHRPKSSTDLQTAAIRFNPMIVVSYGCFLYPAVNALGQLSKGLQASGRPDGMCKGSGHGTQVYGRSAEIGDKFAIMYAYFSPKQQTFLEQKHRFGWDYAIVWIASPTATKFLAVTAGWNKMSYKFRPGEKVGESVKIELGQLDASGRLFLGISEKEGGQPLPLIMWDQLPPAASCSLNHARWVKNKKMPLSDERFHHLLEKAWPFGVKK
jgi:hypothetical protein